ncbi:MAG: hypothetical protein IJ446_03215 [Oscillospiraceae bacterium]|nr:hypothetical protein [Oscillospiraceae bacterium]
MKPLLEITSIPIDIEVNITRASLEVDREAPVAKVSRDKGEFTIDAEPIKINIDNSRMYDSIGFRKPRQMWEEEADKGLSLVYQGIAKVANEADSIGNGTATPQSLAAAKAARTIETVTGWLPEDGPDISWSDGKLSINYKADQLNFDFSNPMPKFKFNPGSVEFIINQLPKVEIEYTGEPLYFPASADPNHKE